MAAVVDKSAVAPLESALLTAVVVERAAFSANVAVVDNVLVTLPTVTATLVAAPGRNLPNISGARPLRIKKKIAAIIIRIITA